MADEIAVLESTYPVADDQLPEQVITDGPYEVSFARNDGELDLALRLRFEVFNEELGEGLAASYETGRDFDAFDPWCHHLVVRDTRSDQVVGTYRMQTAEMAARYKGFYSAGLFELESLPESVLKRSVEVGRACVARTHRSQKVLFLLWSGTTTGSGGEAVLNRITWTPFTADSVQQLWETSTDEGATWTVAFDGRYVRTGR